MENAEGQFPTSDFLSLLPESQTDGFETIFGSALIVVTQFYSVFAYHLN